MKFRKFAPLAGLCVVTLLYAATPSIDPKLYLDDVKYLASPELKGRATGSPELEKAAASSPASSRNSG